MKRPEDMTDEELDNYLANSQSKDFKRLNDQEFNTMISKKRPEDMTDAELDAYLAAAQQSEPQATAVEPSALESVIRGAVQGGSLGFADEVSGVAGAAIQKAQGNQMDLRKLYEQERDASRKAYKASEATHPNIYMGGQFAGGVGSAFIPGLNVAKGASIGNAAFKAALQGGLAGAGSTENSLVSQEGLQDVGIGAGIGAAAGAVGQGLGNLYNKVTPTVKDYLSSAAAKVGRVLTGVDDKNILHYARNIDRVNAAPTVEAIKDSIDDVVVKASDNVALKKEGVHAAKSQLDDAYRASVFDLSRSKVPEELSSNIMYAMDNQKVILGELSDKADDILVESGQSFKKKDLLSFVDSLGMSVGAGKNKALIGDEAVNAVNKLKVMRDRIHDGLSEDIDAQTLRDVLRQVRKDINFNSSAGEFNDTLNKLKTEFTSKISTVIKDKSPEYAEYMNVMSKMSSNLEEMSKNFGTKEKALSSLNLIGSNKGILRGNLLKEFGDLTGKDYHVDLNDFKATRKLLDLTKRQDMKSEMLPELYSNLKSNEKAFDFAKAELEPIKRLSRESTQNAIRQQGFKTPNIENRKAFEKVSELLGTDVLEKMKDRAVLDSFNKELTQGSKRTLMYGSVGSAVGGLAGGYPGGIIGGAIGGATGSVMDSYGGQVAKGVMDSSVLQSLLRGSESIFDVGPQPFIRGYGTSKAMNKEENKPAWMSMGRNK